MLKCNIKGVSSGYPFLLEAETIEVIPAEYNPVLTKRMLHKINLPALQSALKNISSDLVVLPVEEEEGTERKTGEEEEENEDYLRRVHQALFEIHVQEGSLVCPESGRKFPIKDGIPNMILHEDEV